MGLWLTTLHSALAPQVPGQGSTHFCWTQAMVRGHSELRRHSGRQLGGPPKYPFRQEQTGRGPSGRHSLYGPQGSGVQGSTWTGTTGNTNTNIGCCFFIIPQQILNMKGNIENVEIFFYISIMSSLVSDYSSFIPSQKVKVGCS